MRFPRTSALGLWCLGAAALAACGPAGGSSDPGPPRTVEAPAPHAAAPKRLTAWPMFGLTATRPSATDASPGITAANARRLRRTKVKVPGTVDSTPIILGHTAFATTTYGKTVAVDLASGRVTWTFTPHEYEQVAG